MMLTTATTRWCSKRLPATMALLALALVLASCSGIEEPNVVMTGVDIKGISTDGIELDLLVEVAAALGAARRGLAAQVVAAPRAVQSAALDDARPLG